MLGANGAIARTQAAAVQVEAGYGQSLGQKSAQDRQYPTVNALLTGLEGQVGQLLETVLNIHDSASLLFGYEGDPRNTPHASLKPSADVPVGQVARLAALSDAVATAQRFAESAAARFSAGL